LKIASAMPELTPEAAAAANRFISSLSKSLQALCHGCMDFDSGIQIMGYINVSIDSDNNSDYVLNEKVQKSTDNSMTFVSNSYLSSKKDQPKQTRDECCSPVPEIYQAFSAQNQYGSHTSGAHQFYDPNYPQSQQPQSRAPKRALSGVQREWRTSPGKVSRRGRPSNSGQSDAVYSQHHGDAPKLPPEQSQHDSTDVEGQGMNIKTEPFGGENSVQQQQFSNSDNVNSEIGIKPEPDLGFHGKFDNDSHGSNEPSATRDKNDFSERAHLKPDISQNLPESGDGEYDDTEHGDEGGDELYQQPQASSSADHGEDGSQFEVIEIDEDDEDVSALFNDQQQTSSEQSGFRDPSSANNSPGVPITRAPCHLQKMHQGTLQFVCQICSLGFSEWGQLQRHTYSHSHHNDIFAFKCQLCAKGYITKSGLDKHMKRHEGAGFSCPVCDKQSTQKSSLKIHLRKVHKSAQCPGCNMLLKLEDFDSHMRGCKA